MGIEGSEDGSSLTGGSSGSFGSSGGLDPDACGSVAGFCSASSSSAEPRFVLGGSGSLLGRFCPGTGL